LQDGKDALGRLPVSGLDFHSYRAGKGDARTFAQLGGRTRCDDPTLVDDQDARAGHLHFAKNVTGEQDRMPLGQSLDKFPDFTDLSRVETDGRLIQDQDIRLIHQGIRQSDALTVSLGEGADELIPDMSDAAEFQRILYLFRDAAGADSFQCGPIAEILVDAHLGIKGDVFREIADSGTCLERLAVDIESGDPHLTGIRREIPAEDFHCGALTRAIRPEKPDHLSSINKEREIPDGIGSAIAFGESLDRDHAGSGKA